MISIPIYYVFLSPTGKFFFGNNRLTAVDTVKVNLALKFDTPDEAESYRKLRSYLNDYTIVPIKSQIDID